MNCLEDLRVLSFQLFVFASQDTMRRQEYHRGDTNFVLYIGGSKKRNISMSKSYIVSNQGEQFGYQSLSVIGSCCCSFFNVKIEECEDEFILVLP